MSVLNPPGAHAVRLLLSDLLGRDVDIKATSDPIVIDRGPGALVGVYTDDRNRLAAVVVFDLPLAAYAGAAIGLIPPGGAHAAIEDRELPDGLAENAAEILNIVASMFNADDSDLHLRLSRTLTPGEAVPADVAREILTSLARVLFDVTIKGYGTGRALFITCL